jgi:hypothetical protein
MKLIAVVACVGVAAGAYTLTPSRTVTDGAVPVRFTEGALHGFLVLRTEAGKVLAHGDLLQIPKGDEIESRMVFRFPDGSLYDERVTFTQDRVFAMQRYHLTLRGPAFPEDQEARLDRGTGKYRVVTTAHRGGKEEVHQGDIDFPPDLYNGMVITIAKNLASGAGLNAHFIAFTPKPRLVGLELALAEDARVTLGAPRTLAHYVIKPKLGPIVGLIARLAGKLPPDNHAWILTDDVPAFVRFEGPLYIGGPTWRIELATPQWPDQQAAPVGDEAQRQQR